MHRALKKKWPLIPKNVPELKVPRRNLWEQKGAHGCGTTGQIYPVGNPIQVVLLEPLGPQPFFIFLHTIYLAIIYFKTHNIDCDRFAKFFLRVSQRRGGRVGEREVGIGWWVVWALSYSASIAPHLCSRGLPANPIRLSGQSCSVHMRITCGGRERILPLWLGSCLESCLCKQTRALRVHAHNASG